MTQFTTEMSEQDGKFKLVFETDELENYKYILAAAQECVEGRPVQRKIEKLKVETMQLNIRMQYDDLMRKLVSNGQK